MPKDVIAPVSQSRLCAVSDIAIVPSPAGSPIVSHVGDPPVASVPHESTPFVDFTSQFAAPSDEATRFVDDAVVAEIIVDDANGIERPVPAGAAKLMVRPEPPTSAPVPVMEIAVPFDAVVVATD